MTEPPPALIWMKVINPDAEDVDRIGRLVDVLGVDDDPDLRGRTFVLEFGEGERVAFSADEVLRVGVS